MAPVQHTQQFTDDRTERALIESDGNGLSLHRMKNTQAAVGDDRGSGGIDREFPLEAPIRLAAAFDMPAEVRTGIVEFCIGILESLFEVRICERRTLPIHVAY